MILAFAGLPVSLMAAGNAKSQTQETTKILPSQTSGEINCFSYESFSGKSWTYNDDEAYIDLGSSNEKAEECFYRVTFKGNAIEAFALFLSFARTEAAISAITTTLQSILLHAFEHAKLSHIL